MIERTLQMAYENGSDIVIQLKSQPQSYRGSIREMDGEHFSLFHNGCCQGMLWVFRLDDVAACGLLIPHPTDRDEDNDSPPHGDVSTGNGAHV